MVPLGSNKETFIAGEAAKLSAEITKKHQEKILQQKREIIKETSKYPVIITVGEEDCILYEKKGVVEIASAKKLSPAFKSVAELLSIISEMEE